MIPNLFYTFKINDILLIYDIVTMDHKDHFQVVKPDRVHRLSASTFLWNEKDRSTSINVIGAF